IVLLYQNNAIMKNAWTQVLYSHVFKATNFIRAINLKYLSWNHCGTTSSMF
ncbi:hypothetical protein MKW92_022734, partial [Papaver armeniacum]